MEASAGFGDPQAVIWNYKSQNGSQEGLIVPPEAAVCWKRYKLVTSQNGRVLSVCALFCIRTHLNNSRGHFETLREVFIKNVVLLPINRNSFCMNGTDLIDLGLYSHIHYVH